MTIERGGLWGAPLAEAEVASSGRRFAASDGEVAELAAAGRTDGGVVIELADLGGDLARTLGIDRRRPVEERYAYPFDLGLARLDDGPELPFVAGLVARRRLWRGEFAIVANCGWWGPWYVGPRAHPNDGLLDVTVGALSPVQRVLAYRRVPNGSHLPHPDLTTLRHPSWEHRFAAPIGVSLDHRPVGRARSLRVSIEPDCFTLVV